MDSQEQPRKGIPLSERNLPPETISKIMNMISRKVLEEMERKKAAEKINEKKEDGI